MVAMGSDQKSALTLKGVSRSFGGINAVVDVDLVVPSGERRALIGPNGAGKSTLFNLITGEISVDQGQICLYGQDLTEDPVQKRIQMGLGRTYQTSNLFMQMTVQENIFLAAWRRGERSSSKLRTLFRSWKKYPEQCSHARELAALVGLAEKIHVTANELSHGEHRQLELGITLAHDPRILLLDEPMAGLSANERIFMTDLIMGLRSHITVVIIEHDIETAFRIADQVSVLHQGRIIAEGSPDQVRANQGVQEIYTLSSEANGEGYG